MLGEHTRRLWLACVGTIACCLIGCATVGPRDKSKYEIALQWDTKQSSPKIDAIWLAYLMARANYIGDHEEMYDSHDRLPPSFEEEIEGRTKAADLYRELKAKDRLHDSYFEDLVKVRQSGFLPQYVWRHLLQTNWPEEKIPKNLSEFDTWAVQNIPGHRAVTRGAIVLKPR